jgi:hypothetical protein
MMQRQAAAVLPPPPLLLLLLLLLFLLSLQRTLQLAQPRQLLCRSMPRELPLVF